VARTGRFLAGRGESLGSRKGVGEVLLLRWILRDVPGGPQGPSFPLRLTTDQELMPTRGIHCLIKTKHLEEFKKLFTKCDFCSVL